MFSGAAHRSCKYITLKNGVRAALGLKIIRLFGCVPFFFPLYRSFRLSLSSFSPPPRAKRTSRPPSPSVCWLDVFRANSSGSVRPTLITDVLHRPPVAGTRVCMLVHLRRSYHTPFDSFHVQRSTDNKVQIPPPPSPLFKKTGYFLNQMTVCSGDSADADNSTQ